MTQKEFIKELHQLYLEDIDYWMKERFEEKGLHAELKQGKENAMIRAINKNHGMDYDYLEWALDGQQEYGQSFKDGLSYLEYNPPLSGCWDHNTDEENEEIFNIYKKYYDTIPMEEYDKQVHRNLVMENVEKLKDKTSEEIDKALWIFSNDFVEEVKHEISSLRQAI